MDIVEGLLSHMVLQRNRLGVSDAAFSGRCKVSGTLMARVRSGGKTVRGFARVRVGRATGGKLTGHLKGLPTGGPYDVELKVADSSGSTCDSLVVKNVLVGDVWILGGQSNMQGIGLLTERLKPWDSVRAFYMDDRWAPAEDPIHNMHACVDQVHVDLGGGVRPERNTITGVGPGVAFGQSMFAATGVPQGVIACAHGGTSMAQWDPKLKRLGGRSLYGATVRRFRKNGSRIAGVVWYQGESDANSDAAPLYTRRMKALLKAMRRDFGDVQLPFVMVQIARVIGWPWPAADWSSVQEQERLLPGVIERMATVPAIDLPLSDSIHVGSPGQERLGGRLARAMRVLRQGRKAGKPPVELKSMSVRSRSRDGMADLIVEFGNVEGKLVAGARPAGFTLRDPAPCTPFYDVELDGNKAVIHTALPAPDVESMALQYGFGPDPYCNITDEADRAVPAFGPVAIGSPRALTPFAQSFLVSDFLPADAGLKGLECPGAIESMDLSKRSWEERMCARTAEILKTRGECGVFYYACRLECPEAMRLNALVGYDGPVKVWLDGRQVLHDPSGTNPASPADAEVALGRVPAGEHEVVVALGNNAGNAWGIFLRLERMDVSAAKLKKGPEAYAMPLLFV